MDPHTQLAQLGEIQTMLKDKCSVTFFLSIYVNNCQCLFIIIILHHLSLSREGRLGTTDDFTTSFLHFPLFSTALWDWQTPGLSIPWCYLSTSSSVCLVFFPLSLCLSRWFWPDLMNGRHDHTIAVCVSLRWSEVLRVVLLPAGSWHGLPLWLHGLCMRCVVSCGSTYVHDMYSSLEPCCEGLWFTSIQEAIFTHQ